MKKFLSVLLSITMLLTTLCITSFADDSETPSIVYQETDERDGYTYTLYSDGLLLFEVTNEDGQVPNISLWRIDNEAVKAVQFAEGVVTISDSGNVIKDFPNLTKLILPSTFDDDDIYYNCPNVSTVEIDENNTKMFCADGALYRKEVSGYIYLIHYLKSDSKEFVMNTPNVFGINFEAFIYADNLEKIKLQPSCQNIKEDFNGCTNLKEFEVFSGVNPYIHTVDGILHNNYRLIRCPQNSPVTQYTLPEYTTEINNYAFYGCKNLVNVVMHDNVKMRKGINDGGFNLFENAVNLESVVLANSIEIMHDNFFKGCVKLKSVNLPTSLKTIGPNAFDGCASLGGSIIVPNEVGTIGEYAFAGTGISEITLPDGITKLNNNTFENCENLSKVVLPDTIKTIYASAFENCVKLETINTPAQLTKILTKAFKNCVLLKSINFTNVSIGDNVFQDCIGITDVTMSGGKIGSCSFGGCSSLEKVTLDDTVSEISGSAFINCTSLTEFTFPKSVKRINKGIFTGCENLEKLTINAENATICDRAFEGMTSIKEVTLPETVSTLGHYAFAGTSITSINVPGGMSYLGTGAFKDCVYLKTFTIPEGVFAIPPEIFEGCVSLESVTANEVLEELAGDAFKNCTSFKIFNYPGTLADWKAMEYNGSSAVLNNSKIICIDGNLVAPYLNVFNNYFDLGVNIPVGIITNEAQLYVSWTDANGKYCQKIYTIPKELEGDYYYVSFDENVSSVTFKVNLWENMMPVAMQEITKPNDEY